MRKIIIVLSGIGIIILAFFCASFFSNQKKQPEKKVTPEVKKHVATKKVEYEPLSTSVITYGRVETSQYLDLISEVAGKMLQGKVRLKEGQNFSKGTLLFYVDDQEASLNLKAQKSNFLRDLSNILPDIKYDFPSRYEEWRSYFDALDINKTFIDFPASTDAQERTFLATKGILSLYYSIKSAEVRLAKYRYYAPFDGSIVSVNLQSGAFVTVGSKIAKVTRKGSHELKVAVETKDIAWVRNGTPVNITSEDGENRWKGAIVRISDFVNQNTQSIDVFVAIETNRQKIYDGQFFKADIPLTTIQNGMIIPRDAIYNQNEVFVLEDSFMVVKNVHILRYVQEEAIIEGLEEGAEVVVEQLIGGYNNMKAFKKEDKQMNLEIQNDEKKSEEIVN